MSNNLEQRLLNDVRVINDFPKPGIAFRDITTLLNNPELAKEVAQALKRRVEPEAQAIAGIESRGFLFGMHVAMELDLPFIPIRKKGKLPARTHRVTYDLEYGTAEIEVHKDAITPGLKVHVHDDFLATGGSALAAAKLIAECGGKVSGFSFLMGIEALKADEVLKELSPNIAILARC